MARRSIGRRVAKAAIETTVPPQVPDDTALAIRALLREAYEARGSLTKFYNFVIKHEITKEQLTAAPHQEVMFSFIEEHARTVIRIPVGCAKTFSMAAFALKQMGDDATQRGGAISKTQKQASKMISMISDYITEDTLNANLTLVYPELKKSPRKSDAWNSNQITVDRVPGIRDPTVVALGVESAVAGARFSWMVSDDTIDDENTNTAQSRDQVNSRFDGKHISRLDPSGSQAVVTNTPWNREDLTYHLEESGWPTLTMDIYGNIKITNANAGWMHSAQQDLIRPSILKEGWFRLRAHDPDPCEETPLWPDRYNSEQIARIRYGLNGRGGMLPHEFARTYLCQPFDEGAARCQREWIEKCKELGMGLSMVSQYKGPNTTYTGVDIGIGTGVRSTKHDLSVLFTFELWPNGLRRILDIESGRWDGQTLVNKLIGKHDAYGSVVAVENNSAQDFIRQWALKQRPDLLIRPHSTQATNKRSLDFGVESLFSEFQNMAWMIPCDTNGMVHPEIQKLIDAALFYQPPPAHTPDHLMAMWFARERCRKNEYSDPAPTTGRVREGVQTGGF